MEIRLKTEEKENPRQASSAAEGEGRQKRCYKCLLREMDQGEYFKNLYAYIDGLEEEIKAAEPVYRNRLGRCRQCDLLLDGMCRACGCFVELRAVIAVNSCPYGKW